MPKRDQSDTYGAPKSRCPACKDMVREGTKHTCRMGRHRDPFINPIMEKGNPYDK